MYRILLLAAAVIPPILLFIFINRRDQVEKEPAGLLVLLAFLGMAICFPAGWIENLFCGIFAAVFPETSLIYIFIENMIVVALAEEGLKYLVLRTVTWNHPAFNYTFDGVVYAVFVSLGFALLENVMYVLDGGFAVAVSRAIFSIPGHACFGLFMGVWYGEARRIARRSAAEAKKRRRTALLIAAVLHGVYDLLISMGGIWAGLVFDVFVIILFRVSLKRVRSESASDLPVDSLTADTGAGTNGPGVR